MDPSASEFSHVPFWGIPQRDAAQRPQLCCSGLGLGPFATSVGMGLEVVHQLSRARAGAGTWSSCAGQAFAQPGRRSGRISQGVVGAATSTILLSLTGWERQPLERDRRHARAPRTRRHTAPPLTLALTSSQARDIAPCRSRSLSKLVSRCTVELAGLFGSGPPSRCRHAFPQPCRHLPTRPVRIWERRRHRCVPFPGCAARHPCPRELQFPYSVPPDARTAAGPAAGLARIRGCPGGDPNPPRQPRISEPIPSQPEPTRQRLGFESLTQHGSGRPALLLFG
jgi:hypothetical protein